MTTRLYTFANGGLPSDAFLTAGNFISAIKAALVTGTSKKQAAGWKLVYESLSNPNDSSKRIVVQSKSANSEQRFYEIVDGNNAKLTMYETWDTATNTGGGRSARVYINKMTNWDGENVIIADDKFVFMIVTHVPVFFGDYDTFVTDSKSIILGTTSATSVDSFIPADTTSQSFNGRIIYDINGQSLFLRNYHVGWRGWSISTDYTTAYVYNGTSDSAPYIRKVDILLKVGSQYSYKGLLPHMIYCDKLLNQGDITANNKKVVLLNATQIGYLMCEVDEL